MTKASKRNTKTIEFIIESQWIFFNLNLKKVSLILVKLLPPLTSNDFGKNPVALKILFLSENATLFILKKKLKVSGQIQDGFFLLTRAFQPM